MLHASKSGSKQTSNPVLKCLLDAGTLLPARAFRAECMKHNLYGEYYYESVLHWQDRSTKMQWCTQVRACPTLR